MNSQQLDMKDRVLLLGEAEDLVYIDKKMLAACGFKRPVFESDGVKTARVLSDLPKNRLPLFILCAGVRNMDSLRFLELIRLHPDLTNLPVVLVMSRLSPQVMVEASRLGACTLLARPYTQQELENAILAVGKEQSRRKPCPDASMFEQALIGLENEADTRSERRKKAEKPCAENNQLHLGQTLLRQGKYREALVAFAHNLDLDNSERGATLQGIAEAAAGLGLLEKSLNYMQQAAAAYIKEENFMAARALFSRIYEHEKRKLTDNPLYQAGARLVREGRYHPAAQAFMQGQVLTPEISFHAHAARACQFASDPEYSAEEICWHVERRSPSLGRQLRSHLLTPNSKAELEFERRPGLWSLLREVVEVARYTARINAAG